MKEKFESALAFVLAAEGGYVNDPNDPGGETKYGISKKAYPLLDITNLTREQAVDIYRRDYWNKVKGDELPAGVDIAAFDTAVNMGAGTALGIKADNVADYLIARLEIYCERVKKNPKLLTYLRGWVLRVVRLYKYIRLA